MNAERPAAKCRRHTLPAAVALSMALASSLAPAATHPVANCNDDGPGSLRVVVGAAGTNSGDTVDLSGLTCGTISLSTGAIVVNQADLTILGPGAGQLTIERNLNQGKQRIFKHLSAFGTLSLSYMTIEDGYYGGPAIALARGGCIYSLGLVALDHVRMTGCVATAKDEAGGGAIFAADGLTLKHSTLSGNTAQVGAGAADGAFGGGAAVLHGEAKVIVADVSDNFAVGSYSSNGGGLSVYGALAITSSAITGNLSAGVGGGSFVRVDCSHLQCAGTLAITNSTISGNHADLAGGIYANVLGSVIQATTIADNSANYASKVFYQTPHYVAAGLATIAGSVELESSLLANNVYGNPAIFDRDFSHFGLQSDLITGADNLIRNDSGEGPSNSMQGACPRLGQLRDNGGPTKTHALLSGSPAIDAGNDSAGVQFDQRGDPDVRDDGPPDIGAYEVQKGVIFNASFDGCPLVPAP